MLIPALLLLALAPPQQNRSMEGLIRIDAGKTYIGSELDLTKERIAANPASAQPLGAETPRTKQDVPLSFVSPTVVTNEMYLQFVLATGAMPPATWAKLSTEMRTTIIQKGKEEHGPGWSLSEMNLGLWWAEHWQDGTWEEMPIEWEMPPKAALEPVVFVNYYDAIGYCRWAGLRLPTEYEWTRAARGDEKWDYPFGKDFDLKRASFKAAEPMHMAYKRLSVGSFDNASPFGCIDMVGNVWEWIGDKNGALPGFKSFAIKTNGTKIDISPNFDDSYGIIKGGSFQNGELSIRIDTRLGVQRETRAALVGFRVASSGIPCLDVSKLYGMTLNSRVLGGLPERTLDFKAALGLEKRAMADLTAAEAARQEPGKGLPAPETTPGYGIFDRYQLLSIVPVKQLDYPNLSKMANQAEEDNKPLIVGMLTTTENLSDPNTTAGTFFIGLIGPMNKNRILEAGGIVPKLFMPKEVPETNDAHYPLNGFLYKPEDAHLVLLDETGDIRGVMPLVKKPKLGRIKTVRHDIAVNLDKDCVEFRMAVPGPRGKAWSFRFRVKPMGKQGSLSTRDYWDGDYYEIIEPVEEE